MSDQYYKLGISSTNYRWKLELRNEQVFYKERCG